MRFARIVSDLVMKEITAISGQWLDVSVLRERHSFRLSDRLITPDGNNCETFEAMTLPFARQKLELLNR